MNFDLLCQTSTRVSSFRGSLNKIGGWGSSSGVLVEAFLTLRVEGWDT
jgi:hypothetical protein